MKRKFRAVLIGLFMALAMTCAALPAPAQAAVSKYTWKEKVAPNYVKVIGKAKVTSIKKGKIKYSKLDKYGRTRKAVGKITYTMVKKSEGSRYPFAKNSDPSGWGKNSVVRIPLYNGKIYRGYALNRSHLIADSLGGKGIRRNLITGTRMQNVGANDGKGGMAYTERKAVKWLKAHHKGYVYYAAKPLYKGKELVPRSVIVDIRTSDKSINQRVVVYNAAKGLKINYKTGNYSGGTVTKQPDQGAESGSGGGTEDTEAITATSFVANANTKKFHLPDCSSVDQMSDKNKLYFNNTSFTEMKNRGYDPCDRCLGKR